MTKFIPRFSEKNLRTFFQMILNQQVSRGIIFLSAGRFSFRLPAGRCGERQEGKKSPRRINFASAGAKFCIPRAIFCTRNAKLAFRGLVSAAWPVAWAGWPAADVPRGCANNKKPLFAPALRPKALSLRLSKKESSIDMRYELCPPSSLKAKIVLPASKSISNRVLIMHALAQNGGAPLENISDCDDTSVTVRALADRPYTVDIGAAGTAMRFLTAYFAVTPGTHELTGTQRMKNRPIAILVDALRSLGASVDYGEREGFPPLRISGGTYEGGEVHLSGSVSSQYISALLMIGPVLRQGLLLCLEGRVVSRPYIDMTLALMRRFGASAQWEGASRIRVAPTGYRAVPFRVENDWSAASYWYEMLALSPDADGRVLLPGLDEESCQGDARIRTFFEPLGVATTFVAEGALLTKTPVSPGRVELDLQHQPDLAQTLVVTCALLGKPFHFVGLQSLKIKETDRIAALRAEMAKLGYDVLEANDSELFWDGGRCTPCAEPVIRTYEDHRMAMAFAPACFRVPGIRIDEVHVVSKSYPRFWEDLAAAGFSLRTLSL